MNEHQVALSIDTVAGLGVGAQWLAWSFKMPAIVLLAAVGLKMGSGLDLIHPSQDFGNPLRPVVSHCVAVILHEDFRRDEPADAMEVLIMIEENYVEFSSSQRTLEPEACDTVIYVARAEPAQTSETANAPVV